MSNAVTVAAAGATTAFVVVWGTDSRGNEIRGAYSTRRKASAAADAKSRDDDNDYDIASVDVSDLTAHELAGMDGADPSRRLAAPPAETEDDLDILMRGMSAAPTPVASLAALIDRPGQEEEDDIAETDDVDLIMAQTGAAHGDVVALLAKFGGDVSRVIAALDL